MAWLSDVVSVLSDDTAIRYLGRICTLLQGSAQRDHYAASRLSSARPQDFLISNFSSVNYIVGCSNRLHLESFKASRCHRSLDSIPSPS